MVLYRDHPEFEPDYTPYQVMALGAFMDQGGYWRPIYSSVLGKEVKDDYKKYNWGNLSLDKLIHTPDKTLNKYGVKCGLSLEAWENHGWIHPQDPRGYFEWYTKFHAGRRTEDDDRQIARFNAFKKRFKNRESDVVKQDLLQWGINYNKY